MELRGSGERDRSWKTLFATAIAPSHRFLRFQTELNDPAATACVFEDEWRARTQRSLFPGTEVLQVEDRIAAEMFVPRLSAWPVTITKPVIRAAKASTVLATGATKRPILEQVRAGADYPPIAQVTRDAD